MTLPYKEYPQRSPIKRKRGKVRPERLRGDDLTKLREECLERDSGICQACGKLVNPTLSDRCDDSFHLAHKRGKRMWGDSLDNVEVNCGKCHGTFHAYGKSMQKPVPAK
jgi:5-methylcytosine-specific restriction endonuclease McrA